MTRADGMRGMTLIEVLVALVVLGTAAAALLSLLSVHTANVTELEERALARIAAENAMVDVLIRSGARQSSGNTLIGGQEFFWTAERTPAPIQGLEVLTVTVTGGNSERTLAELSTLTDGS